MNPLLSLLVQAPSKGQGLLPGMHPVMQGDSRFGESQQQFLAQFQQILQGWADAGQLPEGMVADPAQYRSTATSEETATIGNQPLTAEMRTWLAYVFDNPEQLQKDGGNFVSADGSTTPEFYPEALMLANTLRQWFQEGEHGKLPEGSGNTDLLPFQPLAHIPLVEAQDDTALGTSAAKATGKKTSPEIRDIQAIIQEAMQANEWAEADMAQQQIDTNMATQVTEEDAAGVTSQQTMPSSASPSFLIQQAASSSVTSQPAINQLQAAMKPSQPEEKPVKSALHSGMTLQSAGSEVAMPGVNMTLQAHQQMTESALSQPGMKPTQASALHGSPFTAPEDFWASSPDGMPSEPIADSELPGEKAFQDALKLAKAEQPQHYTKHAMPAQQQVEVQIRHMMQRGEEKITVKLHPAELGSVDIQLEMTQDGVHRIVMTAEKQDTLDMLRQDARLLAKQLQDAGIQADSSAMEFNLKQGQQFAQQQEPLHDRLKQLMQEADENPAMAGVYRTGMQVSQGLDIQV